MTTSPSWPEIKKKLLSYQTALDRPDLIACVFHFKVQFFLANLKKHQISGYYVSYVYTIEYQKRTLFHMHFLLFFYPEDHMAEFPSKEKDPDGQLFKVVFKVMIYGPCGDFNPKASCMIDRK